MTSAGGLKSRIHGAVSLLRDTLELKNQKELAKINSNLLSLQRENVDDNETVKVITVLTLIYLPGSFVAVSVYIVIRPSPFLTDPDIVRHEPYHL